jgi:hypothetical protein
MAASCQRRYVALHRSFWVLEGLDRNQQERGQLRQRRPRRHVAQGGRDDERTNHRREGDLTRAPATIGAEAFIETCLGIASNEPVAGSLLRLLGSPQSAAP